MIQELLREMVASGAPFNNVVVLANAYQKQALTDLYGYAPESRNVGGLNIKQIETDFGMLGVVFDPQMPTDEIYLAEMSVCSPVFCPSEGQLIRDVRSPRPPLRRADSCTPRSVLTSGRRNIREKSMASRTGPDEMPELWEGIRPPEGGKQKPVACLAPFNIVIEITSGNSNS